MRLSSQLPRAGDNAMVLHGTKLQAEKQDTIHLAGQPVNRQDGGRGTRGEREEPEESSPEVRLRRLERKGRSQQRGSLG